MQILSSTVSRMQTKTKSCHQNVHPVLQSSFDSNILSCKSKEHSLTHHIMILLIANLGPTHHLQSRDLHISKWYIREYYKCRFLYFLVWALVSGITVLKMQTRNFTSRHLNVHNRPVLKNVVLNIAAGLCRFHLCSR